MQKKDALKKVGSIVLIVFLGFGVAANICSASNSDKISCQRQANNQNEKEIFPCQRKRRYMLEDWMKAKENRKKLNEEQQEELTIVPPKKRDSDYKFNKEAWQIELATEAEDFAVMLETAVRERRKK